MESKILKWISLQLIDMLIILAGIILLYVAARIITKAIAYSWYEVKLKMLKEVYKNGEEKEEKEKVKFGKKS